MEELTLSPRARPLTRPLAHPLGGVAKVALREPAAWALPPVERFNGRAANDVEIEPATLEDIPRWVIVVGGCVFAAVLGALLGGVLLI